MTSSRLVAGILIVGVHALCATAAAAQPGRGGAVPIAGGGFASHQRELVSLTLAAPLEPIRCEDGICGAGGLAVEGRVGRGGWRVGAGPFIGGTLIRAELLGTILRTDGDPRRASPRATYAGAEGAMIVPVALVGRRFIGVRTSIGAVGRISGQSGPRAGFDWSVSLQVPLVFRGW